MPAASRGLALLLLLLVTAVVPLAGAGHRSSYHPGAPVAAGVSRGAPPGSAVGMPIPAGAQLVRPIRIVIDVSRRRVPARERRALGHWIETTQNPLTRIRIENRGWLSRPLTGAEWAAASTVAGHRESGVPWLEAGPRWHRAGAMLLLGAVGTVRTLAPAVRESRIPVTPNTIRTYRLLASRAARQIMVTANQGYGGTTAAGES